MLRERVTEPALCHIDDYVQRTDAEFLLCSTEHARTERTGVVTANDGFDGSAVNLPLQGSWQLG